MQLCDHRHVSASLLSVFLSGLSGPRLLAGTMSPGDRFMSRLSTTTRRCPAPAAVPWALTSGCTLARSLTSRSSTVPRLSICRCSVETVESYRSGFTSGSPPPILSFVCFFLPQALWRDQPVQLLAGPGFPTCARTLHPDRRRPSGGVSVQQQPESHVWPWRRWQR